MRRLAPCRDDRLVDIAVAEMDGLHVDVMPRPGGVGVEGSELALLELGGDGRVRLLEDVVARRAQLGQLARVDAGAEKESLERLEVIIARRILEGEDLIMDASAPSLNDGELLRFLGLGAGL